MTPMECGLSSRGEGRVRVGWGRRGDGGACPLMGLEPCSEPAGESAHLRVLIKAWLLSSVAGELSLAGGAHRLLNGSSGAGRCEGPGKYMSCFSGVMQSRPKRTTKSETSFTCTL